MVLLTGLEPVRPKGSGFLVLEMRLELTSVLWTCFTLNYSNKSTASAYSATGAY